MNCDDAFVVLPGCFYVLFFNKRPRSSAGSFSMLLRKRYMVYSVIYVYMSAVYFYMNAMYVLQSRVILFDLRR